MTECKISNILFKVLNLYPSCKIFAAGGERFAMSREKIPSQMHVWKLYRNSKLFIPLNQYWKRDLTNYPPILKSTLDPCKIIYCVCNKRNKRCDLCALTCFQERYIWVLSTGPRYCPQWPPCTGFQGESRDRLLVPGHSLHILTTCCKNDQRIRDSWGLLNLGAAISMTPLLGPK